MCCYSSYRYVSTTNPHSCAPASLTLTLSLWPPLSLSQGYFDRGFPVLELKYVAKRYARTWMVTDVIASIPYERLYLWSMAVSSTDVLDMNASVSRSATSLSLRL